MPVILEYQPRGFPGRNYESDNALSLRRIHPRRFAEVEVERDGLGAENFAPAHRPAAIDPPRRGTWAQDRHRIVGLGGRAAAYQPAGRDLPELCFDSGVPILAPDIGQQSDRVEVHIDGERGGTAAFSQAFLGFDTFQD